MMWERSRKRLKGEQKAIQKKAERAFRNGESISGRDLARLNRVAGRIEKDTVHSEPDYNDSDWD
jgi:hypothetical protein